jgi:hypothetical protein
VANEPNRHERALATIDRLRPYIRQAALVAVPTAALARAYNLTPRTIIPLTVAAAAAGAGDEHLSRLARQKQLKPILKNYAEEQKVKLADYMPTHPPEPPVQKAPLPQKLADVTDARFLWALHNLRPALERVAREQCGPPTP